VTSTEKVYFNNGGVKVSNSRFIVHGQTFPISGITAVKSGVNSPLKGPIILAILGFAPLPDAFQHGVDIEPAMLGFSLIALGIAWHILGRKYFITLSTASGEIKVLSHSQQEFIERIVASINDAIIDRG